MDYPFISAEVSDFRNMVSTVNGTYTIDGNTLRLSLSGLPSRAIDRDAWEIAALGCMRRVGAGIVRIFYDSDDSFTVWANDVPETFLNELKEN